MNEELKKARKAFDAESYGEMVWNISKFTRVKIF